MPPVAAISHVLEQGPCYTAASLSPRNTTINWEFTKGEVTVQPPQIPEVRKCGASPNQSETVSPQSCTASREGKKYALWPRTSSTPKPASLTFSFLEVNSLWRMAMCFPQGLEALDQSSTLDPLPALPSPLLVNLVNSWFFFQNLL